MSLLAGELRPPLDNGNEFFRAFRGGSKGLDTKLLLDKVLLFSGMSSGLTLDRAVAECSRNFKELFQTEYEWDLRGMPASNYFYYFRAKLAVSEGCLCYVGAVHGFSLPKLCVSYLKLLDARTKPKAALKLFHTIMNGHYEGDINLLIHHTRQSAFRTAAQVCSKHLDDPIISNLLPPC